MRNVMLVLVAACLVAGCATAYQPQGATGGYSERQLSENAFQIRFNGNGYTNRGRAQDFALLRSAEVTLLTGFRYFVIVDSAESAYTMSYTTPRTATTDFSGTVTDTGHGMASIDGTATTRYSGGQTMTFVKPSMDNFIVCFEERPADAGLVYDAELIVRQLKAQYGIE